MSTAFFFSDIFDLQESGKNSTQISHLPFTQIPLMFNILSLLFSQ